MSERDILVGITGASGMIYAQALVHELLAQHLTVHLIPTANAARVCRNELAGQSPNGTAQTDGDSALDWRGQLGASAGAGGRLVLYDDGDLGAPPASGTFRAQAMVVVPCSMNTLGKIAHGIGDTLLTRAAAVSLKERRPLVLVPRETPLGRIDLRNMVAAAEAGAVILPAMPAFYAHPREIADLVHFLVSKICDQIGRPCSNPVRYGDGGQNG